MGKQAPCWIKMQRNHLFNHKSNTRRICWGYWRRFKKKTDSLHKHLKTEENNRTSHFPITEVYLLYVYSRIPTDRARRILFKPCSDTFSAEDMLALQLYRINHIACANYARICLVLVVDCFKDRDIVLDVNLDSIYHFVPHENEIEDFKTNVDSSRDCSWHRFPVKEDQPSLHCHCRPDDNHDPLQDSKEPSGNHLVTNKPNRNRVHLPTHNKSEEDECTADVDTVCRNERGASLCEDQQIAQRTRSNATADYRSPVQFVDVSLPFWVELLLEEGFWTGPNGVEDTKNQAVVEIWFWLVCHDDYGGCYCNPGKAPLNWIRGPLEPSFFAH